MTILDRIIATKRKEVEQRRQDQPLAMLEAMPGFASARRSMRRSILDPGKTGIIAEFKRRSPSKGVINGEADVFAVTSSYTAAGASGLSVLTDTEYFGGSTDDLIAARANDIPIIRKDFIVDEYQVLEARAMGADCILLIAACLQPKEVLELARFATSLELEVLLELHDEEEVGHMNEYTALVGINNRNLKTFEVNMDKSIAMAGMIGNAAVRIAESGISSAADVHLFRKYGFDGFLIGERFMKEADPGKAFADFVHAVNSGA